MVVPPESTTCVQVIAEVNVALIDLLERNVVDCRTRLEQHFHATETVGHGKDDVFVWEIAGLLPNNGFGLCVIIQTDET